MKIEILQPDCKEINRISKQYNINKDCASILINRGLDEKTMDVLTNKDFYELLNHKTIKNIPKAAKTIAKYLENDNAIIYIYGDYDNDGIQSTYIAYDSFNCISSVLGSNCKIYYHVPERKEGYGLNASWCYDIVNNKYDNNNILVVTVDNGITKKYEIDYLKMNNINVVVTDHHCPQEFLTPDCTIVDEFLDNNNEKAGLCGAGVIFKVCSYLICNIYKKQMKEYGDFHWSYIPNVMTATISDMMPVTFENSIFVRNGLMMLNDKECECSKDFEYYMNYRGYKELIPKDVAFEYGPQINACGRMNDANTAIEYLLSEDDYNDLYNQIVLYNDERKDKTKILFIESLTQLKESDLVNVVILNDAGGCAGLIANKLVEYNNKPSVVFIETDDGFYYSGSARSVKGLDLQKLFYILASKDIVVSFGGHEAACGVSILKEDLDCFKKAMNDIIYEILMNSLNKNKEDEIIEPIIYVDKKITVKELNLRTINNYKDVMFYNELKGPIFYLENVKIVKTRTSKNNPNNINFLFKDNTGSASTWCWGYGDTYKELGSPEYVNIVCQLESFNTQLVMNIDYIEAA